MKLKKVKRPVRRAVEVEQVEQEVQKVKRTKKVNTLPPDEYPKVFNERICVRQEDTFRQYLEVSVKRFNGDGREENLENPYFVQITMYQESEKYTGYLKGKTIYLPLENLCNLMDTLENVYNECEELVEE